jgi:hypothetical protein
MVRWEIDWTNIKYSQADLDISDVNVEMVQTMDKHMLQV